jgi:3-hydroxyisobutyrate dehydrogenase-like beta-hydroxyacid dehydrogenase
MEERPRIGFIGLGYMGHGMAYNIRARGFPLTVMAHRKREAVEDLVGKGAVEASSPTDVARQSDVVILCVTGAREVDQLVRGEQGLATQAAPGLTIVDCTTSEPSTLLKLAADFDGISFADAPLGRSPREAWEGKLSVMVGCDQQTFKHVQPVLAAFANSIQYVGTLGNGHRLKLVNNLISLGYAAIYSEALVMARKAGLSTEAFDNLVRSSRMHCAFYETFMGWARAGNTNTHRFALDTALHTISDVSAFERSLGLHDTVAAAVCRIYQEAIVAGYGTSMLPELPRSVAASNGISIDPTPGDR